MILLSHPTGSAFVREALAAFEEAGLLAEFWTTINWDPDSKLNGVLPISVRNLLKRRSFAASIRSRTHTNPFRETIRLFASQIGFSPKHEKGMFSIDAVLQELDRKVSRRLARIQNCDLIYGYEDGALESFRVAADRQIARLYDLPIGYWRVGQRIFEEERERQPEWAETLTGAHDSVEKLARKDEELKLAQRVIVASSFTKETLREVPFATQIEIVPYGAPSPVSAQIRESAGQLRVLFAGSLGQRKGLSYLLEAVDMLGDSVELTLLGRKTAVNCQPLESAVRKHRWVPSLPHAGILDEMQNHDVLVFPSLFEGFGLVVLEAMAQGTPVIASPNTCGPDVITDGVDGFIVPIRSSQAIAEKLTLLLRDRRRLSAMKRAARDKATAHKWQNYRQRLVAVAQELMAR